LNCHYLVRGDVLQLADYAARECDFEADDFFFVVQTEMGFLEIL